MISSRKQDNSSTTKRYRPPHNKLRQVPCGFSVANGIVISPVHRQLHPSYGSRKSDSVGSLCLNGCIVYAAFLGRRVVFFNYIPHVLSPEV